MINMLQQLKRKTKLKVYENSSNYYDKINVRNFRYREDPFSKNPQGLSKIYYEVLLSLKLLQIEPQVKNMNIKFYDFY